MIDADAPGHRLLRADVPQTPQQRPGHGDRCFINGLGSPKSATIIRPSWERMRLAGLMSR